MSLFHESTFWKLNQLAVLSLWIILLYWNLNSPDSLSVIVLILFLISHLLQFLIMSNRMTRNTVFTTAQIGVLILLLGYAWWLPIYLENLKNQKTL